MMVPVRCFTCGKNVGEKYEEYLKRVTEKNEEPAAAMTDLGITRYCCRRTIFTHVDLIDEVIQYPV